MSPAVLPGASAAVRAAERRLSRHRSRGLPVAHARFETAPGSPMARRWRALPPGSSLSQAWHTLAPRRGEGVFIKEGYSAFRGTGLARWLKRRRVRRLEVAGFMTDLCVLATALDAFAEGFEVRVRRAACAARTAALHRSALTILARSCAEVV